MPSCLRLPARSVVFGSIACLVACSGTEGPTPATRAVDEPERDPVVSLGTFEGRFDATTGELAIAIVGRDGAPLGVKAADTLTNVPASSGGIPDASTGTFTGGIVAFSTTAATTAGCASPASPVAGHGAICGDIRLVNRLLNGAKKDVLVRNAYAVVTSLSPGWSLLTNDSTRGHAPSLPSGAKAYVYYEHLLAQDRPSAAATPPTIGFRADRRWSFYGPSGGSFVFRFEVYGLATTCTPSGNEDPIGNPMRDADCDGVPGVSRENALFVDPVLGDDANAGSIASPRRSLALAAQAATSTKHTIVLGDGVHSVTDGVNLGSGGAQNVRFLLGGYERSNGFATRFRVSSNVDATKTTIASNRVTGRDAYGIFRAGVDAPLALQGFTLLPGTGAPGVAATDAAPTAIPAGSSVGMFFQSSPSHEIHVSDVRVDPVGGAGADGNPLKGASGADGQPDGAPGPVSVCRGGDTPGQGGAGGAAVASGNGLSGANGTSATSGRAGGSGGSGGLASTCTPTGGGVGGDGAHGSDATARNDALASGSVVPPFPASWFARSSGGTVVHAYVPGSDQNGGVGWGAAGGGGGGGGGGATCGSRPSTNGGSGGAGGCGGVGDGGGAGGAGIGIWAVDAIVRLRGAVTIHAQGGAGGRGATSGGAGGAGGASGTAAGNGGDGGSGGDGASGRPGSGGNGGFAICKLQGNGGTISGTFTCTGEGGSLGPAGGSGAKQGKKPNRQPTISYTF